MLLGEDLEETAPLKKAARLGQVSLFASKTKLSGGSSQTADIGPSTLWDDNIHDGCAIFGIETCRVCSFPLNSSSCLRYLAVRHISRFNKTRASSIRGAAVPEKLIWLIHMAKFLSNYC